jgi:hypothetical protein
MFITDLACDLRNAGWIDTATRTHDGRAVCEWTRDDATTSAWQSNQRGFDGVPTGRSNASRIWALVDISTNMVIGGNYGQAIR